MTMPPTPIRALVLDYGEVLSHPQKPGTMAVMAAVLGVGAPDFTHAYWMLRRAYDEGCTAAEYWRRVAAAVGVSSLPEAHLAALIAQDIASWTEYREEVWTIAHRFRAAGGRTAFLSNGVPEIMTRIRADRALETLFDAVVVSFEVGLTKPDPAIYQHTLARLGTIPGETLLVDDRTENTAAAAALGIRTLVFTGEDSIEALRRMVALP